MRAANNLRHLYTQIEAVEGVSDEKRNQMLDIAREAFQSQCAVRIDTSCETDAYDTVREQGAVTMSHYTGGKATGLFRAVSGDHQTNQQAQLEETTKQKIEMETREMRDAEAIAAYNSSAALCVVLPDDIIQDNPKENDFLSLYGVIAPVPPPDVGAGGAAAAD